MGDHGSDLHQQGGGRDAGARVGAGPRWGGQGVGQHLPRLRAALPVPEPRGGGTPDGAAEAQRYAAPKQLFQDLIDRLFAETGKTIVRTENEIRFNQMGEMLLPYQLSSGEKQMLMILLTVLMENQLPYVLLMDEPEVSLHFEWQKQLIDLILQLNPNVQLIITTHSPAVIMNGWMDHVTEVTDITLPD